MGLPSLRERVRRHKSPSPRAHARHGLLSLRERMRHGLLTYEELTRLQSTTLKDLVILGVLWVCGMRLEALSRYPKRLWALSAYQLARLGVLPSDELNHLGLLTPLEFEWLNKGRPCVYGDACWNCDCTFLHKGECECDDNDCKYHHPDQDVRDRAFMRRRNEQTRCILADLPRPVNLLPEFNEVAKPAIAWPSMEQMVPDGYPPEFPRNFSPPPCYAECPPPPCYAECPPPPCYVDCRPPE